MAKAAAKTKANKAVDLDFLPERGKREHQKLKAYLILDYLMQETDKEHRVTIHDILDHLNRLGIEAEQRSVMDDIKEINYVLYMLENTCSIDVAVDDLDSGEYDDEMFIQRSGNRREYYAARRRNDIDENDVRLIAEAVYTAKFLNRKKAQELIEVVSSLISIHAAQRIFHMIPELERPRTTNTEVYWSVLRLNEAMQSGTKFAPHTPEKVTFRYQTHRIDDVEKTVDKRKGALYKVSPYSLIINDGNYYLLAFDDASQGMRTYRVDRMKDVNTTGEARDGEEVFSTVDLRNYTQRVFGMFGGKRETVTLLFHNQLLDTVIDRFGTKAVSFAKADEDHFTVCTDIELSEQFFAWVCGFGNKVKILKPDGVVAAYKQHLEKILSSY